MTVTCQVISSNPEVRNIAWLKDGTRLREHKTSTLTLFSVTKKMSGKYQCEAFNDVGSGQSDAVVLQVFCEPPGSWERGAGRELAGRGTEALERGATGTSVHLPLLPLQMLRNLPGLRSSPRQLRRGIK